MVRLTVWVPRPVVAWLDGLAVGSGLTRSDEVRMVLASLAASEGPAVDAGAGGGSSSALGADAAGSAVAVPFVAPESAAHASGRWRP
jgi:hypothetical protein